MRKAIQCRRCAPATGAYERRILLVTALTFLATPVWHYSRTLFPEPYALACLLAAHALYFRHRSLLLVGVLCALALLIKNTFALFAVPLGVHLIARRRWRDALLFSLPLVACGVATLLFNQAMFGSYLQGPQPWKQGNLLLGSVSTLLSPQHGLLLYAPILLSAALGWPALLRAHREVALLAAATFACFFVLTAAYGTSGGGYCYGPRYLTPVVPLLMLGLLMRSERKPDVIALGLLSLIISFLGAVPYWRFFSAHPLSGWLS
jgi:energy-converting hydrogenase Eha subunit A